MYQRLFVAAMAVTIGICGGIRTADPRNSVMACWGIIYPRFCYIEGTYKAVEPGADEASAELLQTADAEQIVIRWKLLELLSE